MVRCKIDLTDVTGHPKLGLEHQLQAQACPVVSRMTLRTYKPEKDPTSSHLKVTAFSVKF